MSNIRNRKIVIVIVALSGTIINAIYGIGLLRAFFDPQYNNAVREIMISAIVLEFGWAALLVWVIFKPFERRHLLLFTAIQMILGNFFHQIPKTKIQDFKLPLSLTIYSMTFLSFLLRRINPAKACHREIGMEIYSCIE